MDPADDRGVTVQRERGGVGFFYSAEQVKLAHSCPTGPANSASCYSVVHVYLVRYSQSVCRMSSSDPFVLHDKLRICTLSIVDNVLREFLGYVSK